MLEPGAVELLEPPLNPPVDEWLGGVLCVLELPPVENVPVLDVVVGVVEDALPWPAAAAAIPIEAFNESISAKTMVTAFFFSYLTLLLA